VPAGVGKIQRVEYKKIQEINNIKIQKRKKTNEMKKSEKK
jgi:hypothetical protein